MSTQLTWSRFDVIFIEPQFLFLSLPWIESLLHSVLGFERLRSNWRSRQLLELAMPLGIGQSQLLSMVLSIVFSSSHLFGSLCFKFCFRPRF